MSAPAAWAASVGAFGGIFLVAAGLIASQSSTTARRSARPAYLRTGIDATSTGHTGSTVGPGTGQPNLRARATFTHATGSRLSSGLYPNPVTRRESAGWLPALARAGRNRPRLRVSPRRRNAHRGRAPYARRQRARREHASPGRGDLPYGNRQRHPLAMHWNGQRWTLTPTPNVGAFVTILRSVAAVSATDAWAVGYADNGAGGTTAVVLRWNGQSWSVGAAPGLASLNAVTALSATDVWVSGTGTDGLPCLANWRGTNWTLTAAPRGSLASTSYLGMAQVAPSTVWAVGQTSDPNTDAGRPVAARTANG